MVAISKIRLPPSPYYVGAQEYKASSVHRTKTIPTSIGYATSSTTTVASSSCTSTTNVLQPLFVGCNVFLKDDEIEIEAMRTIRQTLSFEESDNDVDDSSSTVSFGSRVSSSSSSSSIGSMMFTARRRFQLGRTVERWGGGER
jgi:hypothetical protein